ncbi:MAG: hypothetical protein WCR52_14230 [Bacteroidota bacterium]
MNMISKRSMLFLLGNLLNMNTVAAQNNQAPKAFPANPAIDRQGEKWVAITKVKKPWYAFRSLVVKKFVGSMPEYAAIPGLLFKAYAFTAHAPYFGGIYLWDDKISAQNWFNPTWFARVLKTYKTPGVVLYFKVTGVQTLQTLYATKGDYYSSLSMGDAALPNDTKGLLRVYWVENEAGESGHICLWASEKAAKAYFKTVKVEPEYFDTPVLLWETKSAQ